MTRLEPGDPAPLFVGRTAGGADWWLSSAAGERVVLTFSGGTVTVGWPEVRVTVLDRAGAIAGHYGVGEEPGTVVLDERLWVLAVLDDQARVPDVLGQPGDDVPAPVLVVPRVFEPGFRDRLVAEYERRGGTDSGFVRSDERGHAVSVVDHAHKRRRDLVITDPELRAGMKARLERRLLPEIRRTFQFMATRVGPRTHRVPLGGAVVFSCSLLHEATPVTEGRRYCTLPFLYDAAGEELRRRNLAYVTTSD